ncbi:MAG: hypothetical protein P4L51_03170 [Puia sp.]|nr:hypothetical protein [Puia sp.]
MYNIRTVEELRVAIAELEYETKQKEKSIRKDISLTVDSLRPANLVKNLFGSFLNGTQTQSLLAYKPVKGSFKAGIVRTAVAFGTSLLVRRFFKKKE